MPPKSKIKLPPLSLGKETLGQRMARLRKENGYTQAELADRIGIIRELISNYERERIRPNYEMVIRLAIALEVTTDELLGVKSLKSSAGKPNLKIQRRMKKIEALPESQQKFILKAIDSHLKALGK
jgi:transcriptional regulator with XRE-family HTH domain